MKSLKVVLLALKELKDYYETIAGDWNGEDATFYSGGIPYAEEDAHHASEVVAAIDSLLELLEEKDD